MESLDLGMSKTSARIVLLQLLVCGLLFVLSAGRITEGPRNQTVQPGVWVSFNCTVPCESCVNAWYVEGFPAILNPEEESTDELQLRSQYTQRADGMYTATLEILATEALDGVAVQCSTIFRDETCQPGQEPGSCGSFVTDFSRFAVLSVKSPDTEPTILPSPSPTAPCPEPTEVTVTDTVTDTVTETTTVHETQTVTVTVTTVPAVTSIPTCTPAEMSAHPPLVDFRVASLLTGLLVVVLTAILWR